MSLDLSQIRCEFKPSWLVKHPGSPPGVLLPDGPADYLPWQLQEALGGTFELFPCKLLAPFEVDVWVDENPHEKGLAPNLCTSVRPDVNPREITEDDLDIIVGPVIITGRGAEGNVVPLNVIQETVALHWLHDHHITHT